MADPLLIKIDVRVFALINAIDTCSIWNLLSSQCLLRTALKKGCWFAVARYVRYEALQKARRRPTDTELRMQNEFRQFLADRRGFEEQPLSLADLQAVAARPEARKLGRGEVAALALARNLRCAIMTEDQAARRAAPKVGVEAAQTTPHLLGWLFYEGQLSDGDVSMVISEHEARIDQNRGRLTTYLRSAYAEACRCRLLRDGSIAEIRED